VRVERRGRWMWMCRDTFSELFVVVEGIVMWFCRFTGGIGKWVG
jgi:hypothetical protein